MITVCLYGDLREYGRRFVLHVETPAEALHALLPKSKACVSGFGTGCIRCGLTVKTSRKKR